MSNSHLYAIQQTTCAPVKPKTNSIYVILIKPPAVFGVGLRFYPGNIFCFFRQLPRSSLDETYNRNFPHIRKWVRFENACPKLWVSPTSRTLVYRRRKFAGDFTHPSWSLAIWLRCHRWVAPQSDCKRTIEIKSLLFRGPTDFMLAMTPRRAVLSDNTSLIATFSSYCMSVAP